MEVSFSQNKTYRYQILCKGDSPTTILYVLHGYGQLTKYFIKKFEHLDNIIIVAPEGGHRFYLNGTTGRVGASWMTKEARETDILDNIAYLNSLDQQLSKEYDVQRKFILGFSQGGATAIRWRNGSQIEFDGLIIWASDHPKDSVIKHGNDHFIIGDEDEFIHSEKKELMIKDYKEKGYDICSYIGGHEINANTLNEVLKKSGVKSSFGTVSD